VAAHGRGRQAGRVGQLAGTAGAFAQELDDPAPVRVGQGRQGAVDQPRRLALGAAA
jgi:hypothetical protein